LSNRGESYARALGCFINSMNLPDLKVWSTQYKRTQQTAEFIDAEVRTEEALGEILAGDYDELTYEEIAERFPVEFALRDKDKLHYRYPNGESYMDVVQRIQPLLKEIQDTNNLLIISHQATLRCLIALLLDCPMDQLPYLKIPLHTVIQLSFSNGEVMMQQMRLPVECVDTHRAKPLNCDLNRNLQDACLTIPAHY